MSQYPVPPLFQLAEVKAKAVPHELPPPPIKFTDATIREKDKPKFTGHCAIALEMLRKGPLTSEQFYKRTKSQRLAARIGNLKDAGYVITPRTLPNGYAQYTLEKEP